MNFLEIACISHTFDNFYAVTAFAESLLRVHVRSRVACVTPAVQYVVAPAGIGEPMKWFNKIMATHMTWN